MEYLNNILLFRICLLLDLWRASYTCLCLSMSMSIRNDGNIYWLLERESSLLVI